MTSVLETVLIGSFSGCLAISVCHPIDVIRTKLQISNSLTPLSAIRDIYRADGFRGYYTGFAGPFGAQIIYKSIIFTTNRFMQSNVFGSNSTSSHAVFLSGFVSGGVNALAVAPIEIVRTSMIVNSKNGNAQSISTSLKHIVRDHGVKGLWRSLLPSVVRDAPGMGVYFLCFDKCKQLFRSARRSLSADGSDGPVALLDRIVSGAAAGVGFWVVSLPIDTVKTVIESQSTAITTTTNTGTASSPSHHGAYPTSQASSSQATRILRAATALWKEGGTARFYRGWQVAIARGIPSAAVTLTSYDMLSEYCTKSR